MLRRFSILLFAVALVATPFAAGAIAGNPDHGKPVAVKTAADAAKAKLHPRLQQQLDSGSTANVMVFAVVRGDIAQAKSYLAHAYATQSAGAGIVFGQIRVQALPKLAGLAGVVSVAPIDFRQTGQPLGIPDDQLGKHASTADLKKAMAGLYKVEVPYSKAPAPKGSNFEALKELAVLDAKTHGFADAWNAGYTGTGVTVGVMDGGTDFGHPDLLGTWQVWSGQTGLRAGWNGWPKAFDPFGVLQWLASSQVEDGLSWYVETTPAVCKDWAGKAPQSACSVRFATRTGPSRNFSAPVGTVQHTYQFPAGVSKSGHVYLGSHPDDYLLSLFGERPAFLVTDSHTAGVYDTVYVDLDNDYKFDDEKPVTKSSPVAYRDMNGDGYTDLSGGLLYFISDGTTAVPGGLDVFGVLSPLGYGPGRLVAWTGDFDPGIGGHGTLTASNVVGQGVINGKAPTFSDLPGDHTYPGAVIGGAPDARLAPYGDIYFSIDFSIQLGYYLASRRGVDVTSNSYGFSNVDNDRWDAASQEADAIVSGRRMTPIFSTGNGAPGFGTVTAPQPYAGIAVGASTQFGGTGWDSIDTTDQITDNDVMVWSNRGFAANGDVGVDVVADGSYAPGDKTLNTVLNGQNAWETWGGTSRSTPVTAGATALVYQAWRQEHGTDVPAGFYTTAKDILKSSAQDLNYSSTIQGAGSIDAGAAVQVAAADSALVSPTNWRAGDYRGNEYQVFTNVMDPGSSDSQSFTISGGDTWDVSDRQLVRTDVDTFNLTTENLSQESTSNFNAPDYLIDLTDAVKAHPNADLMVIRANYPRAEFDSHPQNYDEDQAWRLLTYDWTDVNHDGNLWTDNNHNGVVNHADLATSSNIDGFRDINFAASEMDKGEYERFMYHRAGSNALMEFVHNPADRMHDGLFLGLQHSSKNAAIPVTHFQIEVSFYENTDWSWLTTPATATGSFNANITVPADTPYGMYEGAIVLSHGDEERLISVSVAVAATLSQDGDGNITGAAHFGGADVAAAQADSLYNNGSVFGANDWTWRAESGDWRFFFFDVPASTPDGTLFLADTTWDGTAPYTDLDTLVFGPIENGCQVVCGGVFGAPYVIGTVGGSPNANIGAGTWRFDTATGGPEDVVTAPASEGLHALAIHQVSWQGDDFTTPFEVTLGSASVAPSAVVQSTASDSGSFDVTFKSSLDLAGLSAEGFGLSQPQSFTEPTQQDDPNDPSSASIKHDLTVSHASTARFTLDVGTQDVDLFVVYDANNDGLFTNSEIVASSTNGAGTNEFIELVRPADGAYQVWAQGWQVGGTPNVTLGIDVIQGTDLSISGVPAGAISAGTPVVIHVDYSKAMTAGQSYFGELVLGPTSAPSALRVPIEIDRN